MPIPTPHDSESEQDFIGRCITKVKSEDEDMDDKQVQAICFSAWKNKKTESGEKMIKRDEDGNFIVAEGIRVVFEAYISENIQEESKQKEEIKE